MIKDRIIQLIEHKGIAKEAFYVKIGMTSGSFRGVAKKTPLNSDAIANVLSEIPDVNPIWLFTGEGEMLKNEEQNSSDKDKIIALQAKLIEKSELVDELRKEIEGLKKALANAENVRTANVG